MFHLLIMLNLAVLSQSAPQVSSVKPASSNHVRDEMLVSTEWLAQHLHDPDLVLLCVGASEGFCEKAHIPHSHAIRLSDITVTREDIPNELAPVEQLKRVFASAGVTHQSRIVLYGERYGLLAARAYFTLDYLGLAGRAALLNGGIEKWRAEQRALSGSADTPRKRSANFNLRIHEEVRVTTPQMQQSLRSVNQMTLLDARPAEEFSGWRLSEDVSKAGHIPGAKGLYWMDLLVSRENPVLRPDAELQQLFLQAGASTGMPIITYCRSGMQSSLVYFVAKYLGYDARMYDASFFEWSRDDLPVEKSPKP